MEKFSAKHLRLKTQYDFRNLNFILPDSGVSADLKFNKPEDNNLISGIFKFKILKSNLNLILIITIKNLRFITHILEVKTSLLIMKI